RPHLPSVRVEPGQVDRLGAPVLAALEHDLPVDDPPGPLDDPQDRAGGDALAAAALADHAERSAGEQVEAGAVHRAGGALVGEEVGLQVADRQEGAGGPTLLPSLPRKEGGTTGI